LANDTRTRDPLANSTTTGALAMEFPGSNMPIAPQAGRPLPGSVYYWKGNGRDALNARAPTYSEVTYRQVYRGVDVVYHGRHHALEFDFVVAPGADHRPIRARFHGADKLTKDADGSLILATPTGDVVLPPPVAYQESRGERISVDCSYVLVSPDAIAFEIHDELRSDLPLVIDPFFTFGTYLGTWDYDHGNGIRIGPNGAIFVSGETHDGMLEFPNEFCPLPPALCWIPPSKWGNFGHHDFFITKLSPDASQLLWTYVIGGHDDDRCNDLAAARTRVTTFGAMVKVAAMLPGRLSPPISRSEPIRIAAYCGTHGGNEDAFVVSVDG